MKILRVLLVITLGLGLVLSYVPTPVSAGPVVPSTVRIGLFFDNASHQGVTQVTLSGPGNIQLGQRSGSNFTVLKTIPAGQTAKVYISGGHLQFTSGQDTTQVAGDTVVARPVDSSQWIKVAEKGLGYRGLIEITLVGSRLRVVNELNVEEYLYGVVPKEMSDSWPREALKAQAVAARTYVAANLGSYGLYGFDLTDDQYSQAYGGVNVEGANSRAAVDETKGQIIVYNGQPIAAVYHSNSGGYTENSENVWVSKVPYLRGVPDPYSLGNGSSTDQWQVTYSKDYLENWINNTLKNSGRSPIGSLQGIEVLGTGVSGRLTDVKIQGSQGNAEIKNDLIRYYLGNLNSTLFQIITNVNIFGLGQSGEAQSTNLQGKYVIKGDGTVSQLNSSAVSVAGASTTRQVDSQPDSYTFKGKGWGHGVGMSQWGAYGMAKVGKNYKEILTYYFQGTQIVP